MCPGAYLFCRQKESIGPAGGKRNPGDFDKGLKTKQNAEFLILSKVPDT